MRTVAALLVTLALTACGQTTPTPTTPEEPAADATAKTEEASKEAAGDWNTYGGEFTVKESVKASALLANPSEYVGKTVRVEGKVTDVCQKMGCWMVIGDEDKHMRITMKDHAFSVNRQGKGAMCEVEGMVVQKEIDPDTVAHFEEEGAKGAIVPEKQSTDGKTVELVASAVRMQKVDAPPAAPDAPKEEKAATH